MDKRLRALVRRIHIYLGLACALPLLFAGMSGVLLTILGPVDQALHGIPHRSEWTDDPPDSADWMERVRVALRAEHGHRARIAMRPPRETGEPLLVRLERAAWSGDLLYANGSHTPYFERARNAGLWNAVFELHSHLMLHDTGRALLAASSGCAVAILLSGWLMYVVRSAAKRPNRAKPPNRHVLPTPLAFHRLTGTSAGAFIAFVLATGAYLAWQPLPRWTSALAGHSAPPAPKLQEPQDEKRSIRDYLTAAQHAMPGARIGFVILPAGDSLEPVLIRKQLEGETHPNGRSSVWLAPATAEVLAVRPWHVLDAGQRWHGWIYAFHSARLWGKGHIVLTIITGFLLIAMIFTGLSLWYASFMNRRAARMR